MYHLTVAIVRKIKLPICGQNCNHIGKSIKYFHKDNLASNTLSDQLSCFWIDPGQRSASINYTFEFIAIDLTTVVHVSLVEKLLQLFFGVGFVRNQEI